MESFPPPRIPCHICHYPVELEIAKTNEDGEAVHEECYVFETLAKKSSRQPVPPDRGGKAAARSAV
jgi:hypothetical protein